MTMKFFDKLFENFINIIELFSNKDVFITFKNEKFFMAYPNMLKHCSLYFCKELKNVILNENNIKKITISNISDEIFDIILKYIYGDTVDLENVETNGNNFKGLEKFCNDIVAKYPSLIFDAGDFTSLRESALVFLLKRDALQLEKVIIWEYLIKWRTSQNSTLPVDLKKWTHENFETLKTTLQQCLPLIRYFHIPSNDLEQYLIDSNQPVESIILPPRIFVQELPTRIAKPTNLFSTIITYEHVAKISSWIDHKSTSTVLIMKVKGTDEILGGYNTLIWDADNYGCRKTSDSFIFSLKNGGIQNSILSRIKIRENTIWNASKSN
ncbi:hypothetical protein Glove_199g72 [Diversispora epigaea]|uniref:BTB domain-containing protein n=1 Tax=Diversispora epigaea TaxID=1348612 RepID=A0A397IMU8_9GLOM|nr:hypothetical protein Glove_199g72 [Diversispora epigaea]